PQRPTGKTSMTDTAAGAPPPDDGQPGIRILAQYIRDLSFESPHAPESLRGGAQQPQIDLGVELNARGREDGLFEVELKLNARALTAILLGGLVAGALDFTFAVVAYHAPPLAIARSIASGWLGAAARSGGTRAAIIGVLSHFGLAVGMAAVYVATVKRLPALK